MTASTRLPVLSVGLPPGSSKENVTFFPGHPQARGGAAGISSDDPAIHGRVATDFTLMTTKCSAQAI